MMKTRRRKAQSGFALILTISLLALLVLAVYGLSVLVKVNGQVSTASSYRVKAQQNALLSLDIARGKLQSYAGLDAAVSAIAGVMGVPAGKGQNTRQWCGIWVSGVLRAWLVSGENPTHTVIPTNNSVQLVKTGSVSSESSNREFVTVAKAPILLPGESTPSNYYAYWVGDEGVKTDLPRSVDLLADPDITPVLTNIPSTVGNVKSALASNSSTKEHLAAFEQLTFLTRPDPSNPSKTKDVTETDVGGCFHSVTVNAFGLVVGGLGTPQIRAGIFNINTNVDVVWRSIMETYAKAYPSAGVDATAAGNSIATDIATLGTGPFSSVEAFFSTKIGGKRLTERALGTATLANDFKARMKPVLSARSDTFRIRAYGEALNPVTGENEATAYCEAIVQRTPAMIDGTLGRRFVITYFRWLGPDDI